MAATQDMASKAISLVTDYVNTSVLPNLQQDLDLIAPLQFSVFVVWQCKALQNWKFLLSTSIPDTRYYELTYNGDKETWYFDAYVKEKNIAIHD